MDLLKPFQRADSQPVNYNLKVHGNSAPAISTSASAPTASQTSDAFLLTTTSNFRLNQRAQCYVDSTGTAPTCSSGASFALRDGSTKMRSELLQTQVLATSLYFQLASAKASLLATLSAVVAFYRVSTAQPIFVPAGNPRGWSRHLRRPYVPKYFALHACDHLPTDLSSSWTSNRGDILYGRECPESSNSAYRPHLTPSKESNEICRGYIPGGGGVGVGSLANINLNLAISSMFAKT